MRREWKVNGSLGFNPDKVEVYNAGLSTQYAMTCQVKAAAEENTGGEGSEVDLYPAVGVGPDDPSGKVTAQCELVYSTKLDPEGPATSPEFEYDMDTTWQWEIPTGYVPYMQDGSIMLQLRWTTSRYDAPAGYVKDPTFDIDLSWVLDKVIDQRVRVVQNQAVSGAWYWVANVFSVFTGKLEAPRITVTCHYNRSAPEHTGVDPVVETDYLQCTFSIWRMFFTLDHWLWPSEAYDDESWSDLSETEGKL